MKTIKSHLPLILAVLVLIATLYVYFMVYLPGAEAYQMSMVNLSNQVGMIQQNIVKDAQFADVQNAIPKELDNISKSRRQLYARFPKEMREEDQILYMIELEELLGSDILISFVEPETIRLLGDGSALMGMTFTVDYETSYDEFKDIVSKIASDEKISSVRYASMTYDEESGKVSGSITITRYLINDTEREYHEPQLPQQDKGKSNIFS